MKFLSDEWARALKEALNADEEFRRGTAGQTVRLQQVILTPEGEVRYWIRIEDGTIDLGLGEVADPHATITQDHATAAAMARSELSPVTAFMTGRLKLSGDLGVLMGLAGPFSKLPEVMAELDVEY